MKLKHALGAAALITVMGAGVSAQGGHQGHDTKPSGSQGTKSQMSMPAMTDDQFVKMMAKHHQDGIGLVKIEESRGTRSEVKNLAAKIREGQERDLQELQSHQGHQTGGAATTPQGTSGHGAHGGSMDQHHQDMMEQMSAEAKSRLEQASGNAVDQTFVDEMIKHHQMALQMISNAKLKDPELRKLSQKMASEQKRELAELKKLQGR